MAEETKTIVSSPKDYWISPNALSISLNALGEHDRIQASVASGAVIFCYIKDIEAFDFDAGHNFRKWPLVISPTYFNSTTEKYLYVAIPRSNTIGSEAMIVFPSQLLDIYGRAAIKRIVRDQQGNMLDPNGNITTDESKADYYYIAGDQVGSEDYYYIWLHGIITASGDNSVNERDWAFDPKYDTGRLNTDETWGEVVTLEDLMIALRAKVNTDWFSRLFVLHGYKTSVVYKTDPETGEPLIDEETGEPIVDIDEETGLPKTVKEDVVIQPNAWPQDGDGITITDIESKYGLWTNFFLSALGKNDAGGGSGGGTDLLEPLLSINESGLGLPPLGLTGKVGIVWNYATQQYEWGETGGGEGSVTSIGLTMPTGFAVSPLEPISSSGTFAVSFAEGYSLPTIERQGYWDEAYDKRHEHSNLNVLEGITSEKVSAWDGVAAIMASPDSDTIINKWQEVVDFLDTYTEADTLAGLLSNKLDVSVANSDFLKKTDAANTYVTKTYFESLFELWNDNTTPSSKISVNTDISTFTAEQKDKLNIKSMFGFWTEQYLSALGLNDSGGGGGIIIVDDALSTTSENPVQNKVITNDIKEASSQTCIDLVNELVGGGGGGSGTVTGIKVGQSGTTISPDSNGVVTIPAYETNADVTDAENVKNALGVQQGGTRYLKEDGTWDTPSGGGGSQAGTKVYLAQNSGSLTTAMLESQNVVYVISYDYTIASGTTVTVPSGCALEFAGGSINGGTLALNGTYLYGNIKFGTGITISGTCKNATAYQKWFTGSPLNIDAWHRFINNVDCPSYEYEFGSYSPTVYVNKLVENNHSISINGNNATLTYPYEYTATAFFIKPKNADTYRSASVTAAVKKGERYVTVSSVSNLSVGDTVSLRDNTICSFSPFRTDYKQCEFANIAEINENTNTLKLTHPTYGVYKNVGSCYVYAFNTISCHIKDLELRVSEPAAVIDKFTGMEIAQCVGLSLTNVRMYNFKVGIRVYASSNVMVENCVCKVTDKYEKTKNGVLDETGSYPDSYALSIANCQNATVLGGDFVGGRHAISIGGRNTEVGVINREILVKNASAKNIGLEEFQMSIDMHSDAEYVTIEGCNTEGIALRGKNNKLLNNFIYGYQIAASELCNYNHEIVGNVMRSPLIGIGVNELAKYYSGDTYYIYDEAKWFMTSTDYIEDNFVIANNKSVDGEKVTVDGADTPRLMMFVTASIEKDASNDYPGHTYYNVANTKLIIEGNCVRNAIPFITGFNTVVMRNNTFDYDICNARIGFTDKSKPKVRGSKVLIEGNKFFGYGRQPSSVLSGTFFRVAGDVVTIKNNYAQSDNPLFALFTTIGNIGELFIEGNLAKDKFFISTKNHLISKVVISKNTFIDTSTTGGGPFGVTISSNNTSLRTDAIITDNILGDTKCATIQYANNVTYGRNLLYGAMTIVSPYIPSSTGTVLNLDAGSAPSNVNYSTTTYDVATTSDNGNTSGTVTIDGTKAVTVLAITGDVTSLALASGKTPAVGHSAHVILSASAARTVTIAHNSTSSVCPGAADLTLSIPAGGYAEVDFINANSKIYVRGV